jgi:hypothetical protein
MPESVNDRCARSHEYVFLLTKSQKYYYDAEAVKEPHSEANERDYKARMRRGKLGWDGKICKNLKEDGGQKHYVKVGRSRTEFHSPTGRTRRSVWTINCQPTKDAHFATFPEKLVIPCIHAGTSEKGCCPKCGSPWKRILKKEKIVLTDTNNFGKHDSKWIDEDTQSSGHRIQKNMNALRALGRDHDNPFPVKETIGWQPTCKCGDETVIPCTVLDPFMGSGTVALVARNHNRSSIGCELNPDYVHIYKRKLNADQQLDSGVVEFIFEKAGDTDGKTDPIKL